MNTSNHLINVVVAGGFNFESRGIKELIRYKGFMSLHIADNMDGAEKLVVNKENCCLILTDEALFLYGKEKIELLREKFKEVIFVFLTMAENCVAIQHLLTLPVMALVHKSFDAGELEKAILHVINYKDRYICHYLSRIMSENNSPEVNKGTKGTVVLSDQESKVFRREMEGMPHKIIADDTGLTIGTVNTYYRDAKAKIRKWRDGNFIDYAIAFGIISFYELLSKRKL